MTEETRDDVAKGNAGGESVDYDATPRAAGAKRLRLPDGTVRTVVFRELTTLERDNLMTAGNRKMRYDLMGVPQPDSDYTDFQTSLVHLALWDVTDDPGGKGKRFPLEVLRTWPGPLMDKLMHDAKPYSGTEPGARPGETAEQKGNGSG